MTPPNKVKLTDNEDDSVSVKLWSDRDFGNHLLRLFSVLTLTFLYGRIQLLQKRNCICKRRYHAG